MKLLTVITLLFSLSTLASYKMGYSDESDFQLIKFAGEIFFAPPTEQHKNVMRQIHGEKDIILLVHRSRGGATHRFKGLIKKIRRKCEKKRGRPCHITVIVNGQCASSCTYFPFLADYAVATYSARFGFHRTWIINSKMTIQSKRAMAREYVRLGGDEKWFMSNVEKINSDQNKCYYMTNYEEIASGMIDEQVRSVEEYLSKR